MMRNEWFSQWPNVPIRRFSGICCTAWHNTWQKFLTAWLRRQKCPIFERPIQSHRLLTSNKKNPNQKIRIYLSFYVLMMMLFAALWHRCGSLLLWLNLIPLWFDLAISYLLKKHDSVASLQLMPSNAGGVAAVVVVVV